MSVKQTSGEEVTDVEFFITLIVSIMASVIAYYICKWLDGDSGRSAK
jgi:hypothetical protein